MSLLFTFPGQGVQHAGMLRALPPTDVTRNLLEEASDVLAMDVLRLDEDKMQQDNKNVQLGLTLCSYILAQNLIHRGVRPDYLLGLSIGAFAAAMTSRMIDFATGLRLVRQRGQLMGNAYPNGYGMVAILGLPNTKVFNLVEQRQQAGDQLYIANINTELETTVSGDLKGLKRLCDMAIVQRAATAKLLQVNVPSHCVLMEKQAKELAKMMETLCLHTAAHQYVSANRARVLFDPKQCKDDLAYNMAKQVHWWETSVMLAQRGVSLVLEMTPGNVLTGLCQQSMPDAVCVAMQTEKLANVFPLVERYQYDRQRENKTG